MGSVYSSISVLSVVLITGGIIYGFLEKRPPPPDCSPVRSLPTNSHVIGPTHGISTTRTIHAYFGIPRTRASSVWMQSARAKTVRAIEATAASTRGMEPV